MKKFLHSFAHVPLMTVKGRQMIVLIR